MYTSEKTGSDESGDGTEVNPFKTILQALRSAGKEPWPTIYVDSKEEGKVFEIVFFGTSFWFFRNSKTYKIKSYPEKIQRTFMTFVLPNSRNLI